MYIKRTQGNQSGWTLVEIMVASAIFFVAAAALGTMFLFSVRSFAAMSNYATLDQENREAMDLLTREIRQAKEVSSFSAHPPSLTLVDGNNNSVTYTFNPTANTMTRTSAGSTQVLLDHCSLLNFGIFQRPPNTNFGLFQITSTNFPETAKVIQLTWKTSRTISPSSVINSENIQTARIVIRKQQDTL